MKKLLNLKSNFLKGRQSEFLAKKFLSNQGWKVISSNYRNKMGEIDIIATQDNTIAAFEVKYRSDKSLLLESISPLQQKRIYNAFILFLMDKKEYNEFNLQINALFVNSKEEIILFENIFEGDDIW